MAEFEEVELLAAIEIQEILENQARFPRKTFNYRDPFNMSDSLFIKNFRLNKVLTRNLIELVRPYVQDSTRGSSIPIETKVVVSLHFFATGCYQQPTGASEYISLSQSSVSRCINEITEALNRPEIMNQFIKFPNNLEELNNLRQRVFKKSSPNNKITLYLSSRDLVVSQAKIEKLQGVILVDPEFIEARKVYAQITLTFRYGREDEEVMGLKFCNEAIMCISQLYPPHEKTEEYTPEPTTPLQEALMKRLGANAYPFTMWMTHLAPASVQLVPAKQYTGAPIGTSYDIRAYPVADNCSGGIILDTTTNRKIYKWADRSDEKLHRRSTVRMGIRVVQRAFAPPSPYLYIPGGSGRTCKEKAKQHKKALLFGCKSTPLEPKFPKDQQSKSRSVETVSNTGQGQAYHGSTRSCGTVVEHISRERDNRLKNADEGLGPTETNEQSENKSTGHVSFQEQEHLTNGVDGHDTPIAAEHDCLTDQDFPEDEKEISDNYRSLCGGKRPSLAAYMLGVPAPTASVEKAFLLSEGKVSLTASLDKAIYSHGEEIQVNVQIQNNSSRTVKRIKVFVVQHVDVCMFSNGKFKNVVAMINTKDDCPISSGSFMDKTFNLLPVKSTTKNWIALEDSYTKTGTSLASTVIPLSNNPDERNVFAIYVTYYVKVKLLVSVMGGDLSLKLPFTLMHTCTEFEHAECISKVERPIVPTESSAPETIKPEKDGT